MQLSAAENKIEQLAKANAFLTKKKDKQEHLTEKTKKQYARQMAKLHKRISELTALCEANGIAVD